MKVKCANGTPKFTRIDIILHDPKKGDQIWHTYNQASADRWAADLRNKYPKYVTEIKQVP